MIIGVHALVYSQEADTVRAFFKDVLGFKSVDVGGWLIFGLPPAELAVHPHEGKGWHQLYLMTDNVKKLTRKLKVKGFATQPIQDAGWGLRTSVTLPGGDELGIYEPRHASPLKLKASATTKKGKPQRTRSTRRK